MPNTNMSTANENELRIQALKSKRRTFKAQTTMLSNFVNSYQDSASERVKLRNRIDRLHKQFETFETIQDELALLENVEDAERERETTTESFDNAIALATVLLEGLNQPRYRPNTPAGTFDGTISPAPTTSSFALPVQLPKIDLPKFDGRLEKWITFKDAFQAMIHSQTGLNNVQKLQYLRLSLTGRAESAIDAFTVSEENYEAAWNQLNDIYDNKRVLVLRHASLLRDTPPMTNDSPEAIRDFVNHVQLHIRSLQALGRTWEDMASDFITSMMISKMSTETRRSWERTLTDTEVPKALDILKHLRIASHQSRETETSRNSQRTEYAREPAKYPLQRSPRSIQRPLPPSRHQPSPSRWSPPPAKKFKQAYVTSTASNCKVCNAGPHAAYQCPKFLNMAVEERIQAAKGANLCVNCLQTDHATEDCRSGGCRVCHDRHNTKLHRDAPPREEGRKS
ncbi:uncharacterized protein LOC123988933 [Osmia bicornis bicornis]|uniref:uncharacterized protein LOC123988933 n=1 Tax=Osmia bicornis bicornis TaxID=1437191 RepID=UPI001EAE87E6|nr:uncharacterized protein LOC123988933 [Osmia bicornis bicornis]